MTNLTYTEANQPKEVQSKSTPDPHTDFLVENRVYTPGRIFSSKSGSHPSGGFRSKIKSVPPEGIFRSNLSSNIMKYIAYIRVSTEKQGKSGLGLEAQKEIIKHYVDETDIVAWYEEVHSGKDLNMLPELQKAKEICLREGYTLVIAKTDRLRNLKQAISLVEEMGNQVYFCNVGRNADKFMLNLFFVFAGEGTHRNEY